MSEAQTYWNDRYAADNAPWDSGEPSRELQRLLREEAIKPCRMLEFGCGTGTNAIFLAQQGFEVTAIDLSPLAIERAKVKAQEAKAKVRFHVADIVTLIEQVPDLAPPFDFVFDRGVYHVMRDVDLFGYLQTLQQITRSGSLFVTLAGNANEVRPEETPCGPPQVHAHDLCKELSLLFDLIQLREFRFHTPASERQMPSPLGWSAILRRR